MISNERTSEYVSVKASGIAVTGQEERIHSDRVQYAMLPVWLLSTRWDNKNYLFAMNGQTGKLIGDLPISWARFVAWFGGIFAASAAIMSLIRFVFM